MKHLTLTLRRTFTALFLAAALCVQTLAAMPDRLVPCGHTAGIKLYTLRCSVPTVGGGDGGRVG